MSGMQKPFSTPVAPPPPAKKKGSFLGKLVKLVLFLAVVGAIGSMAWHGKRLGEARALGQKAAGESDDQALARAKIVFPWEWTTPQWESWYDNTKDVVLKGGKVISTKTMALKDKATAYIAERRGAAGGAKPATTQPQAAPSGTAPAAAPAAAPDAAAPAGFEEAAKLVDEGEADWEAHNFDAAKAKLGDAVAKLRPMAAQRPANPKVEKALDLANQLLEDMAAR